MRLILTRTALLLLFSTGVGLGQQGSDSAKGRFSGLDLREPNSERSGFNLALTAPESQELSKTIEGIEHSKEGRHDRRFVYVTKSDGALKFATVLPDSTKVPKVVPYIGKLHDYGGHSHYVYVDPSAMNVFETRGCGPGSICGNGDPTPVPKPKPQQNPCGPGSACGQGGSPNSDAGEKPASGQDPCQAKDRSSRTGGSENPCTTQPAGPPS
jgi:hypothetical protein